jgi:hypothetical protein
MRPATFVARFAKVDDIEIEVVVPNGFAVAVANNSRASCH